MFFYCLKCDDYFHFYSVGTGIHYGFYDCPNCNHSLRLISKNGLSLKTMDDVPVDVIADYNTYRGK